MAASASYVQTPPDEEAAAFDGAVPRRVPHARRCAAAALLASATLCLAVPVAARSLLHGRAAADDAGGAAPAVAGDAAVVGLAYMPPLAVGFHRSAGLAPVVASDASAFGYASASMPESAPPTGEVEYKCFGTRITDGSQAKGLVTDTDNARLNVFTMQRQQALAALDVLAAGLTPATPPASLMEDTFVGKRGIGVRFSKGSAVKMAALMTVATVGGSNVELPRKMQGVFWSKGASTHTLVTYQWSEWHEDSGLFVSPFVPFGMAWAGTDFGTWETILDQIETLPTLSRNFSTCKDGQHRTSQPAICNAYDTRDRMAYASEQVHIVGNLSFAKDLGGGGQTAIEVTLQKPIAPVGTEWHVLAQQGARRDRCTTKELYSYDLLQILDADGQPVEPHFSMFLKAMGHTPMVTWSGWMSEQDRINHADLVANDEEYNNDISDIPVVPDVADIPEKCWGTRVSRVSQTASLVTDADDVRLNVFTMQRQQNMATLSSLANGLKPATPLKGHSGFLGRRGIGVRFSKGSATRMATLMYVATVGPTRMELPRKLQGVFWNKGSREKALVTYQWGEWHEDSGLYVSPYVPFGTAWALAKWETVFDELEILPTTSKKFSTCKEGLNRTTHPVVCKVHNHSDHMAYASQQVHIAGNLSFAKDLGEGERNVELTLQTPKDHVASDWHVVAQEGDREDKCVHKAWYHYDLLQILDHQGQPVEPHYSNYLKAMGDHELLTWSGWLSQRDRDAHEDLVANDREYNGILRNIDVLHELAE